MTHGPGPGPSPGRELPEDTGVLRPGCSASRAGKVPGKPEALSEGSSNSSHMHERPEDALSDGVFLILGTQSSTSVGSVELASAGPLGVHLSPLQDVSSSKAKAHRDATATRAAAHPLAERHVFSTHQVAVLRIHGVDKTEEAPV